LYDYPTGVKYIINMMMNGYQYTPYAEKRKKALDLSKVTLLIRRTQANIERAGLVVRSVESRFFGVVRLIVAEKQ
jgi:hypothetical protein